MQRRTAQLKMQLLQLRKETLKNLAGLLLIQTLTFSISVQSAARSAAIINIILLCSSPHLAAQNQTTFLSHS